MQYYIFSGDNIHLATEEEAAAQEEENRRLIDLNPENWKNIKLIMCIDLLKKTEG